MIDTEQWRERFDEQRHLDVVVVPPDMFDEYRDALPRKARYADSQLARLDVRNLIFRSTVIVRGSE